ncbi:MAG: hypothetical protein ACF8GE_01380 [Phycisphaerales bacterium JB043]
MVTSSNASNASRRSNPLLMPFTSIRFGLTCVFLLLVYMSIGSAIPPFRQHPWFDMTEFEWFHTPVFIALIVLVCVNLSSITIRRIPLGKLTLGVWMIHTGVVWLCLSSAYYFLMKVEGDTPVIRRGVVITDVDGSTARLPAIPGATTSLGGTTYSISSIEPSWPILSGEHEGETALSINVGVQRAGESFIRQVLVGYPQYTEDIIPGQGRAVNTTGERLLDDSLVIEPAYESQEWFYIKDSRALYARRVHEDGTRGEWRMYRLPGLARYSDVVANPAGVNAQREGTFVIPRNLGVTPVLESGEDLLAPLDPSVSGYLRYAFLQSSLHPGTRSVVITLPELGESVEVDPSQVVSAGRGGEFTPIGDTGFAYRVAMFADDFVFPDGRLLPMVGLDIRTPEREFTRLHSSDGTMVMDFPMGMFELEAVLPTDASVVVEYDHGGHVDRVPAIVPRARRDRGAGELFSMIALELGSVRGHATQWLPFHQYVFDSEDYAYSGRFRYDPTILTSTTGERVEVLFSRERRRLPASVVLEEFVLTSNIGGFTGQQASIRDWTSYIRFEEGDGWGEPKSVSTNKPAEHGGLWFFQASWDPPQQNSRGFLYTGLGVGNRNGVHQMLASSTLAVIGMCYAFYVKPVIRRRRINRVHEQVARTRSEERTGPVEERELVEVSS